MRPQRPAARRAHRVCRAAPHARRRTSLCESLGRVLDTGVVVMGELVISVAGVDLLYLNVNLLLSSVETLLTAMETPPVGAAPTAPPCHEHMLPAPQSVEDEGEG